MSGRRLWRLALVVALGLGLPMSAAAQDVVEYYGTDAIGSVRIVFDAAGTVVGRMDYGPFGERLSASTVGHNSFAGLFRDGEAGLDYAEARSYQVRTGRFSAPDPVYAGLFAPQGWNRYSYALNSPLAFVDPTGLLADSCVMRSFTLDDGSATMAYDCSVTGGGGGGPSWDLSRFTLSGTSFFGQGRGDGSGRTSESPGGRGRHPATPTTPAASDEKTDTPDEGGPAGPEGPDNGDPQVDCTRTGWRAWLPDFMHFQASFAIPNHVTGTIVGVTVNLSIDRFQNGYFGIGPSAGKSIMAASAATTLGWINGNDSQARTRSFLSGHSVNIGGGGPAGGGVTITPGVGYAVELGGYTPQGGGSYAYSWMSGGNSPCR
jgi:RHS repeat-associated protein